MTIVRRRKVPALNIIPLVDVLIVLIFFFLVTMQMRDSAILNLTLPKIETAGKNNLDLPLVIAIDADQSYYLNQQKVSANELQAGLQILANDMGTKKVLLVADEKTHLKVITEVMDWCRQRGLNQIKLQAR